MKIVAASIVFLAWICACEDDCRRVWDPPISDEDRRVCAMAMAGEGGYILAQRRREACLEALGYRAVCE